MADDHIRYDILAQEALRGVMRKVLAEVARTGFVRTRSTCPSASSSARMRWLTAEGVRCSRRAAASSVPSSTAVARVSASSGEMRDISSAYEA